MILQWRVFMSFILHETIFFKLKNDATLCVLSLGGFLLNNIFLKCSMSKSHAIFPYNSLLRSFWLADRHSVSISISPLWVPRTELDSENSAKEIKDLDYACAIITLFQRWPDSGFTTQHRTWIFFNVLLLNPI